MAEDASTDLIGEAMTGREVRVRPVAACRALKRRTLADFAERPIADVDEGKAKYPLARRRSSYADHLQALIAYRRTAGRLDSHASAAKGGNAKLHA